MVSGSVPDTSDFLTNSSGQVTKVCLSLFAEQYEMVPSGWGETLFA